ncbi:MAG: aminodeoxychorismate synthase component I [Candidatus Scalindua sp.]|nr:aminodeoxychorismate synthase component I [Candidatus Scalindua sp.]
MMDSLRCFHIFQEINSALRLIDYFRIFEKEEYSFVLDSGRDEKKLGRFSFTGGKPFLIFKSKGENIIISHNGEVTRRKGNPFSELRKVMSGYKIDPACYHKTQIPFLGGAVGYFGYELCYFIEKFPCKGVDDLGLPDCYFMLVDNVIIYDHLLKKLYLSAVGFDRDFNIAKEKAEQTFNSIRHKMKQLEREDWSYEIKHENLKSDFEIKIEKEKKDIEIRSMFTQEEYMDVVSKSKEHIFAGDIFEVCTTHRLETNFSGNPFELYLELRKVNPAPFASYLNFPEVITVSSSPERFLRVRSDGWGESRPIKGTRPRGKTEVEDEELYNELFSSIKDRAENMMIVDLVRNDFGRVCKFGTVEVPELMVIERYATVFQMVSTIIGKLEEQNDYFDLIQACYPGGSMTGAPKIEAMTIIDELEPVKRGIYSGSIGYLDFSGNIDLNIVIRTIILKDGKAYFQVGGAIVADSDPKEEYLETLTKAKALISALRNVTLQEETIEDAHEPVIVKGKGR